MGTHNLSDAALKDPDAPQKSRTHFDNRICHGRLDKLFEPRINWCAKIKTTFNSVKPAV